MSMLGQSGVMNVTPPAVLEQQLAARAKQKADAADAAVAQPDVTPLAGYIKSQWEIFRNHRNTVNGWSERLLIALRAFNGQYEQSKIQQIRQFGGSEVYARIIAQKCRAASSLLRDVYLSEDRVCEVAIYCTGAPPLRLYFNNDTDADGLLSSLLEYKLGTQ